MQSQKGKMSSAVLFILIALILGGGIGFGGYWYGVRHKNIEANTTGSSKQAEVPNVAKSEEPADSSTGASFDPKKACASSTNPNTFYNKVIGLEFCYPSSWGEASLGKPEASESVAGSAYEIHFSNKVGMAVSASTTDYQNTVARDGRCEDPTSTPPNFALYSQTWVKDSADSELSAAVRYHIKKDDVYLIAEDVNSFFWGLCYRALANQSGTAYPVVKVVLRRPLGSTTVLDHINNPNVLMTTEERVQFGELVDSLHKPL